LTIQTFWFSKFHKMELHIVLTFTNFKLPQLELIWIQNFHFQIFDLFYFCKQKNKAHYLLGF
jgi:hypothetical protein